jgi:RNA polymerase sigma factor (sigma-70 family)
MDADLVRAAQNGDAAALGAVLKEHEAGMRAVALGILGFGPDAEDAVQDAMLTAVRRIGEVRDPLAVGAWLRAIVRNNCHALTRRPPPVPAEISSGRTPEEVLEKHALRDWVWHAIGELSEADRLVTLLRHFSGVTAYEQIAALCGLPVGTVRSRLSHARRTLAERLRESADAAHPDAGALSDRRWREARDALRTAMSGDFHQVVGEMWLPGAEMVALGGDVRGGRDFAVGCMNSDLDRGVSQKLRNVVASPDILIWETELSGGDCVPAAVWMHELRGGRVSRMTLFHPN